MEEKLLVERKNEAVDEGRMSLIEASRNGDLEMVKYLVEAGANTYIINKKGFNALSYALEMEHNEIADLLYNKMFKK